MTALIDPTGRLVTFTRDAAAVAAITSRVRGGELAQGDEPPSVVIRAALPMTPWVGSVDTQRTGVATWRHTHHCYGPKVQGGDRQALALALAVAGELHGAGPMTFATPGGGGGKAGIYQIHVESVIGGLTDPDTAEPYAIVTTVLTATAHAIA